MINNNNLYIVNDQTVFPFFYAANVVKEYPMEKFK